MSKLVRHIVLYDGVCNLCTRSVRFIIERDAVGLFCFASIQSSAGQAFLRKYLGEVTEVGSVVLIENEKVYVRSDAALLILRRLPGAWRFLYYLMIVPRPLRDLVYRLIARYRYHLFGVRATCLVALPGWEGRFLE
ncbi:MAG: thiol-disulfide oxidoreductase DCC family protein [Sphingomonadales bacterium]